MKKSRRCPKCEGRKIGHLAYVPDQLYSVPDTEQIIGETSRKAK